MNRILHRNKSRQLLESTDLDTMPALIADADTVTWIDIYDPERGSTDDVRSHLKHLLTEHFQFHPLAVEDVLTESNTPKLDDWDHYLYIVLHAVTWDTKLQDVDTAEMDVFLGTNYLITYHDEPIPAIDRVWKNALREERHTRRGADFLLYEVCDSVASDYMPCMDAMDEEIDRIEDQVFEHTTAETLQRIFKLKSAVLNLRRVLSPQREVMNKLARDDYEPMDPKDKIYFRDVYDHFVRLTDLNESLRDLVTGAMDTYLTVTANRTNNVMKTLTIITVMMSPITAITGFFGMNFFGEPILLQSPFKPVILFAVAMLVMLGVPIAFLLYIRRRGW